LKEEREGGREEGRGGKAEGKSALRSIVCL
jgi:hypothetical protein